MLLLFTCILFGIWLLSIYSYSTWSISIKCSWTWYGHCMYATLMYVYLYRTDIMNMRLCVCMCNVHVLLEAKVSYICNSTTFTTVFMYVKWQYCQGWGQVCDISLWFHLKFVYDFLLGQACSVICYCWKCAVVLGKSLFVEAIVKPSRHDYVYICCTRRSIMMYF